MARRPRMDLPGHPQHVIIRGNNRQNIFVADEYPPHYLEKLYKASDDITVPFMPIYLLPPRSRTLLKMHLTSKQRSGDRRPKRYKKQKSGESICFD